MESLLGSFTVPGSHGTFFFNDDVLVPLRRGLPVVSLASSQHLWQSFLTRWTSICLCLEHKQWSFYFLLSERSLIIQSLTMYSHMDKHTNCLPAFPATDSGTPLTPSLSPSVPLKSYLPYLNLILCLLTYWMLSLQDPILHRKMNVLQDKDKGIAGTMVCPFPSNSALCTLMHNGQKQIFHNFNHSPDCLHLVSK